MRALGWFVMIAMLGAIAYGFGNGSFAEEGSQMLGLAWGRATVIDLYLMLAVFATWVWWRERNPIKALAWTVALATLGSVAAGAYLIVAGRSGSVTQALVAVDET